MLSRCQEAGCQNITILVARLIAKLKNVKTNCKSRIKLIQNQKKQDGWHIAAEFIKLKGNFSDFMPTVDS